MKHSTESEMSCPLHSAIKNHEYYGDNNRVSFLLAVGVNANSIDEQMNRPLHIAALQGDFPLDLWKLILDQKPKVNASNTAGDTAMHNLCKTMKALTPSMKMKFILLLQNGANLFAKNNAGNKPTDALPPKLYQQVMILYKAYAPKNVEKNPYTPKPKENDVQKIDHNTAVLEKLQKQFELRNELLGAVLDSDSTAAYKALEAGAPIDWEDALGRTLLHITANPAYRHRPVLTQKLIDKGAYIHAVDSHGRSAWHDFCENVGVLDTNKIKLAEILLRAGVNIHLEDADGHTGMYYVNNPQTHHVLKNMIVQLGAHKKCLTSQKPQNTEANNKPRTR